MMIFPLSIYEELKDKPEKEIRKAIRGYKNQIGRLKKILENPDFEEFICPSHDVQLQVNREYLQNAIMALITAGFDYQPSKAEEKSDLFNDKLAQTACKAAIKGGDDIPLEEINELISGVLNENHVLVCPHGRPIVIKISEKEIEKWFKRIV